MMSTAKNISSALFSGSGTKCACLCVLARGTKQL